MGVFEGIFGGPKGKNIEEIGDRQDGDSSPSFDDSDTGDGDTKETLSENSGRVPVESSEFGIKGEDIE
ncbi:MAG: hypothetical protein PHN69_00975 [Candidatus Pacebacteria bacterium]|nr:hypothetical protein [Candidatus Paceibacterota bacterium]